VLAARLAPPAVSQHCNLHRGGRDKINARRNGRRIALRINSYRPVPRSVRDFDFRRICAQFGARFG